MQIHSTSDLDRLGDEIAELSAHLDAATARLLALIREFDARGGWNTGFRSCAAWLSWRVGLDPGAARERVRVARALETLPLLAQALARGEVSYAKVRALTRVATPDTEARLLAVGRAAACFERLPRTGYENAGMALEAALQKCGWPCDKDTLTRAMANLTVDMRGLRGGPIEWTEANHYRRVNLYKVYHWDKAQNRIVAMGDWARVEVK